MITLKIVWAGIKKHWKILLLVIGGIFGVIFLTSRKTSLVEDLNKVRDAHEREVQEIEAARAEEVKRNQENKEKLDATLKHVEEQYKQEKIDLDAQKKKEIENIVKEHGDDPVALAKVLSDATGLKIILPEE